MALPVLAVLALGSLFASGCASTIFSESSEPSEGVKERETTTVSFRQGNQQSDYSSNEELFSLRDESLDSFRGTGKVTSYPVCQSSSVTVLKAPWFSSGIKKIEDLPGKDGYIKIDCQNSQEPSSIIDPTGKPFPIRFDQNVISEKIQSLYSIKEIESIRLGQLMIRQASVTDDFYRHDSQLKAYLPFSFISNGRNFLGLVDVSFEGKQIWNGDVSQFNSELMQVAKVKFKNEEGSYSSDSIPLKDETSIEKQTEWLGQAEDPFDIPRIGKRVSALFVKSTKEIRGYEIPMYDFFVYAHPTDPSVFITKLLPQTPDRSIFGVYQTVEGYNFDGPELGGMSAVYYSNPVFDYDYSRDKYQIWIAAQPVLLEEINEQNRVVPQIAPATFFIFEFKNSGLIQTSFKIENDSGPLTAVSHIGKRRIGASLIPVVVGLQGRKNGSIVSGELNADYFFINGGTGYNRVPLTNPSDKVLFPFLPLLSQKMVNFVDVDPEGKGYFSGISIDPSSVPSFEVQTKNGFVSSSEWNGGKGSYIQDIPEVKLYDYTEPSKDALSISSKMTFQSTFGELEYVPSLVYLNTFTGGLERFVGDNQSSFYTNPSKVSAIWRGLREFVVFTKDPKAGKIGSIQMKADTSVCQTYPETINSGQISSSFTCMPEVGNPYFSKNGNIYFPVRGSVLKVSLDKFLN